LMVGWASVTWIPALYELRSSCRAWLHLQSPCDFRTGRVRDPQTADEFTVAILLRFVAMGLAVFTKAQRSAGEIRVPLTDSGSMVQ
jgi:hypothetical protein